MNVHCSKDIEISIVYTYNHVKYFCINILFAQGVCMFGRIAEHEGRKTELPIAIYILRNCLFFVPFLFNLFLFNDLINKC